MKNYNSDIGKNPYGVILKIGPAKCLAGYMNISKIKKLIYNFDL
jgi:hypothetical protein